jgi:large subunit ribosomal protein L3
MFSVVGKKLGMSRLYDEKGNVIPVTLVEVYEGCIVDVKTDGAENFNKVVLAYGKVNNPQKKISKPLLGFYKKRNLDPFKNKAEFKIDKNLDVKVGDFLNIEKLESNFLVDVVGISKGKGFAGVMKRWGFKGLRASHGTSISHRTPGSTGQRQDPGMVWKNKKMPGHMGCERKTIKNLLIVDVNKEDKIVCIKGAIPGGAGSDVVIAIKKVSNK